jgi:glutaredoxin 3
VLRTVPEIFIKDKHIGGCGKLMDLEREGKLDDMLSSKYDDTDVQLT